MLSNRRFFGFIFLVLLGLCSGLAHAQRPDWVKQRPVDPEYYIGIGIAAKDGDSKDYIQQAKNAALSDLSSEITVNVSAELVDIAVEKAGLSEEEIRSEIRTQTQADLEGYERVDTWENTREYWVYYRLSKAFYAAKRQERIDNAVNRAMDLYTSASTSTSVAGRISEYVQALASLGKYIAEPLRTEYGGEEVFVVNTIYHSLQQTVADLHIRALTDEVSGKRGRALSEPLKFLVVVRKSESEEGPVKGFPVRFRFLQGAGELLNEATTDSSGVVRCPVTNIHSAEPIQIVEASADLSSLYSMDGLGSTVKGMLQALRPAEARAHLRVSPVLVHVETTEKNYGNPLDVHYLEPVLKSNLSDRDIAFTDGVGSADLVVQLNADTRKGSVIYGQYVAYVDYTLSIVDQSSGKELYKTGGQDIKGIHLDYDRAGLKAYESAGKALSDDVIPELMSVIYP